jgi:hypothetical protein
MARFAAPPEPTLVGAPSARGICLTEDARKAAGVEDTLASYAVPSAEAESRGVDRPTPIHFVAAAPPHEAAQVA